MRSSDICMKTLLSEVNLYNPRNSHLAVQIFANSPITTPYYSRRPASTITRMGRPHDPVLIQSTASAPENRKFQSTLATHSYINGHTTPQYIKPATSTPQLSKDKQLYMGICPNLVNFGTFGWQLLPDTTLPLELRNKIGLRGMMPPGVDSTDSQIERCLARIRAKQTNLDKYI